MPLVSDKDIVRMREQLFFEGEATGRKLSRFWLLLTLSAVIAAAGVVGDSTATVIGAMIVAPLMTPILGILLAVVLADRDNLLRSLGLVAAGAAAVVAIAYIVGMIIQEPILAATNSQVSARVTPRLIDLLAALATGAVGSVALAREDISDTLPGVAIAISLVPPLAVVGLTLESNAPDQAFGALLLFVTNVSAILASGLVVMGVYRVSQRETVTATGAKKRLHRGRATALIALALLVIAVPLTYTSVRVADVRTTEATVTRVATRWAAAADWEVEQVISRHDGVEVRVAGAPPEPRAEDLRRELDGAGLAGETVRVQLVPATNIDLSPSG
jgi:uncharacterized hydrophobic protein (TIGR00271 family)